MKKYSSKEDLREQLMAGIDKLADYVSSTMGPRGRNVILRNKVSSRNSNPAPVITKDGVTVAKFVDLEDPIENVGAQLLKQAAIETNEQAGDGTTTATVLARGLLKKANLYLKQGISPIEIKRGMDLALQDVLTALDHAAIPIRNLEDMESIATVSANNDKKLGALIAKAVDVSGKDGAISVVDSKSNETTLELVDGFHFQGGFHSPEYINRKELGSVEFEDSFIFITDMPISKVEQIMPLMQMAARAKRPLVIVCPDVVDKALAAIIGNATKQNCNSSNSFKIASIRPGLYGEEQIGLMKDLATMTGSKFFHRGNTEFGNSGEFIFSPDDLGTCSKIEILKNKTSILEGAGTQKEIDDRVQELKVEIKHTDDLNEAKRLQQRLSRLASGIALLKVGGFSDVEMIETKHRVIDALEALTAAQEAGMLAGGGVTLYRIGKRLEPPKDLPSDQQKGYSVLIESLGEPMKQIALNSGVTFGVLENELSKRPDVGFNFYTEEYEDLIESGIIDPCKVTKTALKSAVSVSSTILLTDHAIIEYGE